MVVVVFVVVAEPHLKQGQQHYQMYQISHNVMDFCCVEVWGCKIME